MILRGLYSFFYLPQATTMPKQPYKLDDDDFTTALETIPSEGWYRTWSVDKAIMMRRTSKRVKEVLDKMRLPTVVRMSTYDLTKDPSVSPFESETLYGSRVLFKSLCH